MTPDTGEPRAAAAARPLAWAAWLFVAAALLVVPLAHGCHGPDDDHEPAGAPQRSNPDGR